jgi:hypothetical protein
MLLHKTERMMQLANFATSPHVFGGIDLALRLSIGRGLRLRVQSIPVQLAKPGASAWSFSQRVARDSASLAGTHDEARPPVRRLGGADCSKWVLAEDE